MPKKYTKKDLKVLKKTLEEISNNGKGLKASAAKSKIKSINAFYKKHYLENSNLSADEFVESFPEKLKETIFSCETAVEVIKKQYKDRQALQPGILTECYAAKSMASFYGCEDFFQANGGDKTYNGLSQEVIFAMMQVGSIGSARYVYCNSSNPKNIILVVQCGDPKQTDTILFKDGVVLRFECKEDNAKLIEADIDSYDEDGKLVVSNKWKKKYSTYMKYIDEFNEKTDAISQLGHNYNLAKESKYFDNNEKEKMVEDYVGGKNIDMFLIAVNGRIFPILPDLLVETVSFDGSEIRISGKNHKKVFTPIFLDSVLSNKKALISPHDLDENIELGRDQVKFINGRGKSEKTRIKLNQVFLVMIEKVKQYENEVLFKYSDIEQLKPTISAHIKYGKLSSSARMEDTEKGINYLIKMINEYDE